jgi:glucose-1-phosphate adenylyltransferase
MGKVLAFVLAGGRSEPLGVLTKHRAMAAVPFGGRYRIIDFTLSNCVHSRVTTVQIATQYSPHSLQQHIVQGRPWDLDRRDGGVWLLQPYMGRTDSNWYRGTADALYQNLDMIGTHRPDMILVLSGDQVYRMDYGEMIRQHRRNKADVTMAVKAMAPTDSERFGMVEVSGNRVVRFDEKPARTSLSFVNMAIYLFEARWLIDRLQDCVPGGKYDLVWDVLIPAVSERRVAPFLFEGYWEDLGTLDSYYLANRSLLPAASTYLLDRQWPIYTPSEERPPSKFGANAIVHNSVIANGCRVFGRVENSLLFPGVVVGEGSLVRDSILFSGAQVHRRCRVSRCILDKQVVVGDGAVLGTDQAAPASLGRVAAGAPEVATEEGLLVIGKATQVPPGFECRRAAMIDSHLGEDAVRAAAAAVSGA